MKSFCYHFGLTICVPPKICVRPPQILRFGGNGEFFSLICPPQPQDPGGAPDTMSCVILYL